MWSGNPLPQPGLAGARIGRQITKYREKHYFQPVHDHDDDDEHDDD